VRNLLLLSNSTNFGEQYMQWCKSIIASAVAESSKQIVFIPYAGVGFSYAEYTDKVNNALAEVGIQVTNIDDFENEIEALQNASAIFVGGGNTFHLLKNLQDKNLIEHIRTKVNEGVPYVGWSAGSNIASPTICTTNDMPIVEPQSFEALNLIADQINPHYTDKTVENHGGESRLQRLKEFLAANQDKRVLCLPENTYLAVRENKMTYKGNGNGILLNYSYSETLLPNTII
jgi:dipeptidase E